MLFKKNDFYTLAKIYHSYLRISLPQRLTRTMMVVLLFCSVTGEAASIEIPYIPLEVSTFPEKLAIFCKKTPDENCENIKIGNYSGLDVATLRTKWEEAEEIFSVRDKGGHIEPLAHVEVSAAQSIHLQGGTIEQQAVYGLTDFVMTRAKAEASLFMQEEFCNKLCKENSEEREYFKNLCVAFEAMDVSMSLHGMGSYLRAAARKDIEQLPDTYLEKQAKKLKDSHKDYAGALTAARIVLAAYRETREGRSPAELIRGISHIKKQGCEEPNGYCENLMKSLRSSSLLIKAFEENYYDYNFPDGTDSELQKRYVAIGVYFSFVERVKELNDILGLSLNKEKFDEEAKNILKIVERLSFIQKKMVEIKTITKSLSEPVKIFGRDSYDPRLRLGERIAAIDKAVDLLQDVSLNIKIVNEILQLWGEDEITKETKGTIEYQMKKVYLVLDTARELVKGDDAGLMVAALNMAEHIRSDINEMENQKKKEQRKNDNKKEKKQKEEKKQIDFLSGNAVKFIPVLTEIANAQNSKEVANIIEAAAAPAGSYRQKKTRPLTSLTAFMGLNVMGAEKYETEESSEKSNYRWNAFAPLGVHLTQPWTEWRPGFVEKYDNWFHSGGIFLSLIDLGPMVNAREDKEVESQPNVGFKQLFSPGMFLTLALYKPVTAGIGISATPEILKTEETGEDISAWRWQVFVAFDLTILPF